MPGDVEFWLVFLDDAMILTKVRADWSARYPNSYRTDIALGPAEAAADYLEFDYPDWFGDTGRTWAGCVADLAAARHLQSAVFDVPEPKESPRR
ncbi:hypothetical protein ATO6_17765 [Oceanicola sp. 22II-s10i]|uniref:hypothetical protein n=1 Tax=Oceanicola sp. 22II-s10i TaxID=1317116 RepID=UPI000B526270|nr:hypothetical protein [Oceanicola sp. 22II-s10i]OWU83705.1 hypothetical protein ATO6_17765 [Oceanicola sp. 22II-s10i]